MNLLRQTVRGLEASRQLHDRDMELVTTGPGRAGVMHGCAANVADAISILMLHGRKKVLKW